MILLKFKSVFMVMTLVAAFSTPLLAADVYWGGSNGDFDWSAGPWVDLSNNPLGVPVDGDQVRFRPAQGNNATIDINGANTNLPGSTVLPQDNQTVQLWIYDSATLTPNSSPPANDTDFSINGGHADITAAANAAQGITVNNINYHKKGNVRWYAPVTTIGDHRGPEDGSAWYYGDVNFGNDVAPRNNGWRSKVFYFGDYTTDTKTTPYRSGNSAENTFHGLSTLRVNNQQSGTLNFADLHITDEFRQANDAVTNVSGRYSGTATYIRDPNASGETRTPEINLLTGSTLAPGASIGVLGSTALDVNMNSGSTYEWEVGASPGSSTPGVGWDLSLADEFDIDGPLNFQIVELGLTEDISPTDEFAVLGANSFDVADIDLVNDTVFTVLSDQATWDITNAELNLVTGWGDLDGNPGDEDAIVLSGISAQLQSTVIPEPASLVMWLLIGLGLSGFVFRKLKAGE